MKVKRKMGPYTEPNQLSHSARFWMQPWSSWQDLIQNSLTAFSFGWNFCYKSPILLEMWLQASQPLRWTLVPRWSYTWPGHFFSRRWGNARWKSRTEAWMRRVWRNWATSLLGIFLQLWWQNSSFDPFSVLSTTCPLVQCLDQERSWAEGHHSGFAVLGSLLPVPMPAAHCCQHCLLWWGRGEMLNSACKQLVCSAALQLYISSDAAQVCTQGWNF